MYEPITLGFDLIILISVDCLIENTCQKHVYQWESERDLIDWLLVRHYKRQNRRSVCIVGLHVWVTDYRFCERHFLIKKKVFNVWDLTLVSYQCWYWWRLHANPVPAINNRGLITQLYQDKDSVKGKQHQPYTNLKFQLSPCSLKQCCSS